MPHPRQRASNARTYFKKGHKYFPPGQQRSFQGVEKNYSRMDRDTYSLGIRGQNGPPSILRPRPIERESSTAEAKSFDSNIFASMNKLSDMMTVVYMTHLSESSQCSFPNFTFPQQLQNMQGLGPTVSVKCNSCNYISRKFELFKRLDVSGKGNSPVEINVRLGQYMSSSETSLASIQCLFALLNTHSPCEKTLKRNIYKAAAAQSSLGKEQLVKNQNSLNDILDHLPNDNPFQAIVGCDTVYNNPVHGRAVLRGTQSSTPFIEMTTKKGLIIGMESFSQICGKRKPGKFTCDCRQDECTINYPTGGPMSNVEHVAAASFINKIEESSLKGKVSHVLTDGCKQIKCGMNNDHIEQLLCIQHIKRGQMRKFYAVAGSLSSGIFGSADVAGRKRALGNAVVNRCSAELRRTRTSAKNDSIFSTKMEKVRNNLIQCISGDHSQCRSSSSTCKPRYQLSSTSFLLTDHDKEILQQVLDYRWVSFFFKIHVMYVI